MHGRRCHPIARAWNCVTRFAVGSVLHSVSALHMWHTQISFCRHAPKNMQSFCWAQILLICALYIQQRWKLGCIVRLTNPSLTCYFYNKLINEPPAASIP
jgi:hypothetical protein